jgi:hypothetical protein
MIAIIVFFYGCAIAKKVMATIVAFFFFLFEKRR